LGSGVQAAAASTNNPVISPPDIALLEIPYHRRIDREMSAGAGRCRSGVRRVASSEPVDRLQTQRRGKMRRIVAAAMAVALMTLGGCNMFEKQDKQDKNTQEEVKAGTKGFEVYVVPGSHQANDSIIKLDRQTGKAWIHNAGPGNNNLFAINEDADHRPEPGNYSLHGWATVDPSGLVTWDVYRLDDDGGTLWVIHHPNDGGYYWQPITTTISM
jgi:hypothetical protein